MVVIDFYFSGNSTHNHTKEKYNLFDKLNHRNRDEKRLMPEIVFLTLSQNKLKVK